MKTKPKIPIDFARVEALAARGLNQEQIAASLGISPKTLERRKKDTAEMALAIKRGRLKGVTVIANKLFEAAQDGNTAAMIFFLKCQAGWKEAQKIEVTGNEGGPIQTATAPMTPEELAAIRDMQIHERENPDGGKA